MEYSYILIALTGGLAGSIFTAFVSYLKNKTQIIQYKLNYTDIINRDIKKDSDINLSIRYDIGGEGVFLYDLISATLTIQNTTNVNFDQFEIRFNTSHFGIIKMQAKTPGNSHEVKIDDVYIPKFYFPKKEIIISLDPFNKKDVYVFNILLTTVDDYSQGLIQEIKQFEPKFLDISSKAPIEFKSKNDFDSRSEFKNLIIGFMIGILLTLILAGFDYFIKMQQ